MKPTAAQIAEATRRFHDKRASLMGILPQVAGPMLGGYAGRALAQRYGSGELGQTLGTIGGLTAGRFLSEEVLNSKKNEAPQQAPYAMDGTAQDIPAWALQGAQMMRPLLKQSSERIQDVLLGEIPGYAAVEGYRHQGAPGAVKGTLGQVGGAVGGGALGFGAGKLLSHFMGRDVNVPLVNMPLSHMLAGLGATVGATKGFQGALGLNH